MKIALFGTGKMGKMVEMVAKGRGHTLVSFSEAELCIDFSHPESAINHLKKAADFKKNMIMGTTGWYDHLAEAEKIVAASRMGFLYAANFSIGVRLFSQLVKRASLLLEGYEARIVETHHTQKVDAPSGTALMLQGIVGAEIESIRFGDNPGKHEVSFDSLGDTITLTHQAKSREAFALGSVLAAEWLKGKRGFYTLDDMMREMG